MPRSPSDMLYDILSSFRGEIITKTTLLCRGGLDNKGYEKNVIPLIDEGYIDLETLDQKRRYYIKKHSLTFKGQKQLLALGGKVR